MLYVGVAALRATLATPRCNSSYGGEDGAASARPYAMQRRSKTQRSWAIFDCLGRPAHKGGGGGRVKELSHLEIWAPNIFLAEAEPLAPAAF